MRSKTSDRRIVQSSRPLRTCLAWVGAALSLLLVLAFASSARAGAIADSDGDLVPDQFDDCSTFANGPNQLSNQVDTDLDGYGNRCDPDYDNDCAVTPADFGRFLLDFGGPGVLVDLDGDLSITPSDFGIFLTFFGTRPPGPSGLACANCGSPTPSVCTP